MFDTLNIYKRLRKSGLPDEKAETLACLFAALYEYKDNFDISLWEAKLKKVGFPPELSKEVPSFVYNAVHSGSFRKSA